MKLFTRYNRINVVANIIIFLIASAAFYFTLHLVLMEQIDSDLLIEEGEIITYVQQHQRKPESISVQDQIIEYREVTAPFTKRYFTNAQLIDPVDKDKENFRQLTFGVHAGEQWYEVTVSKSLEDTNDLTHSILLITFITILAILVVSFIINRVVLKRIWKPFYLSLDKVKDFEIGSLQPIQFEATSIDEFSVMNHSLKRLTSQAQLDYMALKTFSENASHEIQTPIAIIRSKLDMLIQDNHLTQQQSLAIQSAYNAVQRLANINQSLLLLAKIENKQYQDIQIIDLHLKLQEKLMDFQELWMANNITVEADIKNSVVTMNKELADILLNNLISNATRHNYPGGKINVSLKAFKLIIANTSPEPALDLEKIFQRFYKSTHNNDYNGLGLSIIKQICDASGFSVSYLFANDMHVFTITFDPIKKN